MARVSRLFVPAGVLSLLLLFMASNTVVPSVLAESPTPTPQSCIPLDEALQKGLIQVSFVANGGLFFQDALDYTIVNKTQEPLSICIATGLVFKSQDDAYQNLVVGRTIVVTLAAGGQKKGKLNVFCINLSRHAPTQGIVYSIQGMADGDLLKVAQAVEKHKAYGRLGGQFAVWNVTDKFSLADLGDLSALGGGTDSGSNSESGTDSSSDPIALIRPFLGLASGELKLGQEILDDATPGARLYEGDLPPSPLPDIPGLNWITWLTGMGGTTPQAVQRVQHALPLILIAVPLICCLVPLAGIFSVIMLRRR